MNRFRETGLWPRIQTNIDRIIHRMAGSTPGDVSEKVEKYVETHFPDLLDKVKQIQYEEASLQNTTFISRMRQRVKTGKGKVYCKEYLDQTIPGWLDDEDEILMLADLESALVSRHFE